MYTFVLNGSTDVSEYIKGVSLEESVDSIAYTAKVDMVVAEWMSEELALEPGYKFEIIRTEDGKAVFNGIIWDKMTNQGLGKNGTLTLKEPTIYLEKSEDQCLFEEGTTASDRNRELAGKWDIPLGDWDDTGVGLAKGKPETDSIYRMMWRNLVETYEKGGRMYRHRMGESGLELKALASNDNIYDITEDLTAVLQQASIEGAITRVKILGKKTDESKTPVLGEFDKNTDQLGTLQKVINDDKINDEWTAQTEAEQYFSNGKGSITTESIDAADVRAGDTIYLRGMELYVAKVVHILGEPGLMRLDLETEEQIAERYKKK